MNDWLRNVMWPGGHFHWAIIGWLGNVIFFSRFSIQWYVTERKGRVVVPESFWWLSLAGSLLLLIYAIFSGRDLVFIFAYAFNWVGFVRNLVIHYRHEAARQKCAECGIDCAPSSKFCCSCGCRLRAASPKQ